MRVFPNAITAMLLLSSISMFTNPTIAMEPPGDDRNSEIERYAGAHLGDRDG